MKKKSSTIDVPNDNSVKAILYRPQKLRFRAKECRLLMWVHE